MSVLSKQFKDALSRIEPGEDADHARDAHAEVRAVLHKDEQLTEWGLHTLLIGSYAREVSIRRVKDADVFCMLPSIPKNVEPQELLATFAMVLKQEYGTRLSMNDRSVKVDFPDFDMHVDVVPARPLGDEWEIPDPTDGWSRTNPDRFTELSSSRNAQHGTHYVPTVKLVRQTRRALLGEAKPGGLFVEVAAYHAFETIPAAGATNPPTSAAGYYAAALEAMAPLIRKHADGSAALKNPAVPDQNLRIRATDSELNAIANAWDAAAKDARAALETTDDQEAGRIFKRLLGKTSDGTDVFTVPTAITAGHRALPSRQTPTFG